MDQTLPLFPLRTVLLPGVRLPLHIFESRYRRLTVDLVTGAVEGKRFGILGIRPGVGGEVTESADGADGVDHAEHVYPIGCTALLRQVRRLPDGRFDIVVAGERRFRLLEMDTTSAPYALGTVEWLPDHEIPSGAAERMTELARSARAAYRRYRDAAADRADWNPPPEDADHAELPHLLAADCLLPMDDRQRLLEELRPPHRLRLVSRLLNREAGFLAELDAVPAPPAVLDGPACLN